jgi:DoxX-like family
MTTTDKFKRTAGYAMSSLVIAFMLFDAGAKLIPLDVVIKSTAELGYAPSAGLARGLGALALVCTALYALPRTALLGAILLTGYMGGAVASHLRVGDPLFSHILFGVYLGIFIWGGLFLRDSRIRALLPFRSPSIDL